MEIHGDGATEMVKSGSPAPRAARRVRRL